jgi:acyl transferase domain-containing protein
VYVEVDDTGAVQSVHVDGYHYLVKSYPEPLTTDGGRPTLRAADDYHFYTATQDVGEDTAMYDMADRYGPWIRNGWSVHEPAVLNPWTVKTRGHWWDESYGVSAEAVYWRSLLKASESTGIDFAGAAASDLS